MTGCGAPPVRGVCRPATSHGCGAISSAGASFHPSPIKKGGFREETALTLPAHSLGYEVPRQVVPEGVVETVYRVLFVLSVVERRLMMGRKVRKMCTKSQQASSIAVR